MRRIDETERKEEEEEEEEEEEQPKEGDLTTPNALLLTLENLRWLCASEMQCSLRACTRRCISSMQARGEMEIVGRQNRREPAAPRQDWFSGVMLSSSGPPSRFLKEISMFQPVGVWRSFPLSAGPFAV